MFFPRIREIAIATLVLFLTGLATWSFSAQRISHELAHDSHAMLVAVHAHDHDAAHIHHADHADDDGPDDKSLLSDTEHNLLHAAAVLQPVPLPAYAWQPPIQDSARHARFIPPDFAPATREPPFRPPRHLLS